MPSKICPGCGKEKDYTEYYLTPLLHSTKDGRRSRCIQCYSDMARKHREANPDYLKQYALTKKKKSAASSRESQTSERIRKNMAAVIKASQEKIKACQLPLVRQQYKRSIQKAIEILGKESEHSSEFIQRNVYIRENSLKEKDALSKVLHLS